MDYKGQYRAPEGWDVVDSWPEPTIDPPSMEDLMELESDGESAATDGCVIESDGVCQHGHPSWLVVLGLI